MASSDVKTNEPVSIPRKCPSVFANLPNELKDSVIDELPTDVAKQVQPHRIDQKRKRMAASRAAITLEKLKATSKTPITKLPTEIRAKIFKHLLPDKRTSFVPLKMLKHFREKRKSHRVRTAMMGVPTVGSTSQIVLINNADSDDASTFGGFNG